MLFKRVNRDQPEQVFVVFENNEGATINKDATVQMDETTDVDGIKARDMDSGSLFAFLGVADAAVADNDFGLAQVYGYRSTSQVFQTNTTQAAGLPMVPVAAQEYWQTTASTLSMSSQQETTITIHPYFAVLMETIATSSASATISAKIFIRAL